MDSSFNFDLLFDEEIYSPSYETMDIFKEAALRYSVNLEKDLNNYPKKEIALFKETALRKYDGTYRLRSEDRNKIISEIINNRNIYQIIDQYKIDSEFSNVVRMLLDTSKLKVSDLTNKQIYYAISMADVFPDRFDLNEFRTIYRRRQFFKQFQKIIKNFAGRKKELDIISEYVDWLPKQGLLSKIRSEFRNIIDWHEKPPLLIKGVGGIGKSTLVAKFILNQNIQQEKGNLPFIYIDFDLPGFSIKEPMTILLEALRQINIQYFEYDQLINKINGQISKLIYGDSLYKFEGIEDIATKKNYNASTESSRNYIYTTLEDVISEYSMQISALGKSPIMVVFDSFEEMQYRASSSELHNFFAFIQEISKKIPRIRPIFAGRSEVDFSIENIKFQNLEIKDFDKISANALLEKNGIEDKETRDFIYANFGGNPLMLNLAINLAQKKDLNLKETKRIKGAKWKYLINRILGHIHDDQVRKIAIPGMLVRYVNPNVIKEILAKPTKVGFIKDSEAKIIFNELEKEVALISKSINNNEISFRQDLRMMCESMILDKYPHESKEIRENAIEYYSKYSEMENITERNMHMAEYFFHKMKRGDEIQELSAEKYIELRPYLEQSIIELPASARRYISSLINRDTILNIDKNITNLEWENNYLGIIKKALNTDLPYLLEVHKKLDDRKSRTNNGYSEFGLYEALIYQRLNKIENSNTIINNALNHSNGNTKKNKELDFEFQLLKIQNYEYEERYDEALKLCNKLKPTSYKVIKEKRVIYEFLKFRIDSRINQLVHPSKFFKSIKKFKYNASSSFLDVKWEFVIKNISTKNIKFMEHYKLNQKYREFRKELQNLNTLEGYAKKNIDFFLKDITYAGHFNIVLRDVLFAKEITEDNSENRSEPEFI